MREEEGSEGVTVLKEGEGETLVLICGGGEARGDVIWGGFVAGRWLLVCRCFGEGVCERVGVGAKL